MCSGCPQNVFTCGCPQNVDMFTRMLSVRMFLPSLQWAKDPTSVSTARNSSAPAGTFANVVSPNVFTCPTVISNTRTGPTCLPSFRAQISSSDFQHTLSSFVPSFFPSFLSSCCNLRRCCQSECVRTTNSECNSHTLRPQTHELQQETVQLGPFMETVTQ